METCAKQLRQELTLSTSIQNLGSRGDTLWTMAQPSTQAKSYPHKILPSAVNSVKRVVVSRLRPFNGERAATQAKWDRSSHGVLLYSASRREKDNFPPASHATLMESGRNE